MHAQGTPLTHVRINPIDMNTENWDAFVEASVIILYTTPLLPPPPPPLLPNNQHDPPLQPSPYSTPSRVFFLVHDPILPPPSFSRYTAVRFSVSFDLIGRGEGTPATPI